METPRTGRKRRIDFFGYSQWWPNRDVHRREGLTLENGPACARVCVRAAAWYIGRLRHSRYSCSNPSPAGVYPEKPLPLETRARESQKRSLIARFSSSLSLSSPPPPPHVFRAFQRVTSTTLHRPLRTRKSAASAPRQCQDTPISSFYAKPTRLEWISCSIRHDGLI